MESVYFLSTQLERMRFYSYCIIEAIAVAPKVTN